MHGLGTLKRLNNEATEKASTRISGAAILDPPNPVPPYGGERSYMVTVEIVGPYGLDADEIATEVENTLGPVLDVGESSLDVGAVSA